MRRIINLNPNWRFTGPDGAAVRDAAALKPGDEIRTRFARGEAVSVVSATAKGEK